MRRFVVQVSVPEVYEIAAADKYDALDKAEAQWRKTHSRSNRPPVFEIITEEGIGLTPWDCLDSAIDAQKERAG